MGRRANVNPPLTINGSNTGYNAASLREDDDAAVQADETDIEGSQ